jgi:hypothetical protein
VVWWCEGLPGSCWGGLSSFWFRRSVFVGATQRPETKEVWNKQKAEATVILGVMTCVCVCISLCVCLKAAVAIGPIQSETIFLLVRVVVDDTQWAPIFYPIEVPIDVVRFT